MSELDNSMIKIAHYDWNANRLDDLELGIAEADCKNYDKLLSRVIVAEQANLRQGTSSVKTRGEVTRSTRKLYRQKGTGNARAGDAGSPTRYHGGVAFGPNPRSYNQKINRKERKKAFTIGVSLRHKDTFCVTGEFGFKKTKEADGFLKNIGIDRKILMIVNVDDGEKRLLFRNIQNVELVNVSSVTLNSIMKYPNILITQTALDELKKRLHDEG
ncbi:MAG: 50S ribosomal protein L4 [Epsilonproteobacteria bacterium]|nr:50S ribosomal protein L4 [Campylobacterota bacterium]